MGAIQPSFFSSWQTYKLEVAPKWWGNTKETGKIHAGETGAYKANES
jgi:hypothetical protein